MERSSGERELSLVDTLSLSEKARFYQEGYPVKAVNHLSLNFDNFRKISSIRGLHLEAIDS
jgi:hypothetical protein